MSSYKSINTSNNYKYYKYNIIKKYISPIERKYISDNYFTSNLSLDDMLRILKLRRPDLDKYIEDVLSKRVRINIESLSERMSKSQKNFINKLIKNELKWRKTHKYYGNSRLNKKEEVENEKQKK